MADICEICMKPLKYWEDEIPDYDGIVLCSNCNEEVECLYERYGRKKEFEECIELVRRKIRENSKNRKFLIIL